MSLSYHPFHIVTPSPWPAFGALSALVTVFSVGAWVHGHIGAEYLILLGLFMLGTVMFVWWRDVIREATFQGLHTLEVQSGLKQGVILFIVSEALLFFSFFWAYFHNSLTPSVELGAVWPPIGIEVLNPYQVPLLNTAILLSSGATVTWAHHGLIAGKREDAILGLFLTVLLGVIFTGLQAMEYVEAPFSIADSIYGTTFFMTTGLHGAHVLVGTAFLVVSLVRMINYHFTRRHHLGLEAAIMYWHFVDYVWLVVFAVFYCWAS